MNAWQPPSLGPIAPALVGWGPTRNGSNAGPAYGVDDAVRGPWRPFDQDNLHMKNSLLTVAAASLFAVGGHGHGDDKPGSARPKTQAADGRKHSHDADHAHGVPSAIGAPGDKAKVTRTVGVDMTDTMRFRPASVDVKQGETIRFVVRNSGRLMHEFVLGTDRELKEHAELMKKFPEMEHSDPNQVSVAPGMTGDVIWQFTETGQVVFACLQPGHYDAGMKGIVKVVAGRAMAKIAGGHERRY